MKIVRSLLLVTQLAIAYSLPAQQTKLTPDLSKVKNVDVWTVYNRQVTYDNAVHLNGLAGDGFLRLNGKILGNARIELDIKGKDEAGMSFVGLAFHGLNDSTYDAIYFRPFNFKNPARNDHSVQYVSQPQYSWSKLRDEHPGKYESTVSPVPEPAEWFHATIVIEYPVVKVFVNNSTKASLTVNQLSSQKKGWIGFWVGNNAEGYFKNLVITAK